jgi:hypothetical protein
MTIPLYPARKIDFATSLRGSAASKGLSAEI